MPALIRMTSSSVASSSFLATTPPPLLASTCQFLAVVDLLRLLRSCSALRRLATDDASFRTVACSASELRLVLDKQLDMWSMPWDKRVADTDDDGYSRCYRYIPIALWQQAVPAFQYSLEQWAKLKWKDEDAGMMDKLRAALSADKPTEVRQTRTGEDCTVVSYKGFGKEEWCLIAEWRLPCFRSHLVLKATPHLRHLHIDIDPNEAVLPPALELFSFVPRLRSLVLQQLCVGFLCPDNVSIVPIRDTLAALPTLTSFECYGLKLSMQDAIDIAGHAPLEQVYLTSESTASNAPSRAGRYTPSEYRIDFWYQAKEYYYSQDDADEAAKQQAAAAIRPWHTGAFAMELSTALEGAERRTQATERLHRALTRVVPSHRSVKARLALAHYLHRHVYQKLEAVEKRRSQLPTAGRFV